MNFDDLEVRINKPYPEIEGATNDPMVVGLLKNLANSREGELTGMSQYVFQSVVADKTSQDIAKILEEIAVVEMTHQDLLMHAMNDFGGVPRYEDSQGNQFTTSFVNYSTKLKDMLEADIKGETIAIENYEEAMRRVKNDSLKKLFARIMEDEKLHLLIFKTIRDNVTFLSI